MGGPWGSSACDATTSAPSLAAMSSIASAPWSSLALSIEDVASGESTPAPPAARAMAANNSWIHTIQPRWSYNPRKQLGLITYASSTALFSCQKGLQMHLIIAKRS